MSTGVATLTHKELQNRAMDRLGQGVHPVVAERMAAAAQGKDWVALYEAKESLRLGRTYRANAEDPRLLLRILRYERGVFTETNATQRAWIEELIQSGNRAAHSQSITRAQADRAIDTMILLADSLELTDTVEALTSLRAQDEPSSPPTPNIDLPTPGQAETAQGAEPAADGVPATAVPQPPSAPAHTAGRAPQGVRVPTDAPTPAGTGRLSVRLDALDVVVLYREAVNYALVHNDVSPIVEMTVTNRDSAPIENVHIEVSLATPPGQQISAGAPLTLDIGTIPPVETLQVPLQQLRWRLNPEPFVVLEEAVSTTIRLSVHRREDAMLPVGHNDDRIRLLTAEEWWARSVPELLGAFVRPNDPAIGTLLSGASRLLEARTGSSALEGYQSGSERVNDIAESIFDALRQLQIAYVEPPASFEGNGQRIRTHSEVLTERRATCLDLACLYAAALEQAGIHPVLVVTTSHAFTGYLTEESQLPSLAVTERGAFTTIADSDMFDAVETTAVCAREAAVTFDQSRGLVRHWWRADLAKVQYFLDVRSAHRRVRPLPSIRVDQGVRVVEVVREPISTPARYLPAQVHEPSPSTEGTPPPRRIVNWQRALLDMTYLNPLLKLKKASSTAVHVPASMLATLEDKMADGESIELVAHDAIAEIHAAQGHRTAADIEAETLGRIMREENRLFVALSSREYTTRLRNLQRRARRSLDETGTDSLYLALGTLEWDDNNKQGRAPLFLLPVRLTGGKGGTRFELRIDDTRSVEPNYCLVEKLRVTWGVTIPELTNPDHDSSGIDVERSLAAVRSALLHANLPSFHVEEGAHLALLQFSTLDMWRDLRSGWQEFIERPVVKHLVSTPGEAFIDGIEPPATDHAAEANTYLPIPADGSQIEAIRWAAAGKSFILEGPPGTGKSQTITNLIAHCLAERRKVLFVAEKQAALDVVKRRLESVGLGVLSLDLHGKHQTVAAAREQIKDALDASGEMSPSWDTLRAQYRSIVQSMAKYPAQLHEEGPVEISAWSARQMVLELSASNGSDVPASFQVPRSVVMGDVPLDEVYDAAHDLATGLIDLGVPPERSPWRFAGPLDPNRLSRSKVAAALEEFRTADAAITTASLRTGVAAADTPWRFAAIATWLDSVRAGGGRTSSEARHIVTDAWHVQARTTLRAVNDFRDQNADQLGDFRPAILTSDLGTLIARSMEIDKRVFGKKKRRLALLQELKPMLRCAPSFQLKDLTSVLQGLAGLRDAASQLAHYAAQLPGIQLPYPWNALEARQAEALDCVVGGLRAAYELSRSFGVTPDGAPDSQSLATIDRMSSQFLQVPTEAVPVGDQVRTLDKAWTKLMRGLVVTEEDYRRWLAGRTRSEAVAEVEQDWYADATGNGFIRLRRWLRVRYALKRLADLGLGAVAEPVYSGTLRGIDVEAAIRLGVAQAILAERLDSTGLAAFDDRERQGWLDRFLSTGEDVRERMATELAARIVRSRRFDPNSRADMVGELRQQLGRRRGGLSVRQLLERYGSLIQEITPCFLMSPASVSRFLPVDKVEFDVVVFDEASQIRVAQAIGAMGRGRSVVVVGDSKQMPPSSMFTAGGMDEEDEIPPDDSLPVPVDLESILSESAESSLPRRLLTWHYRSRDESLIAFSNNHYYDDGLSSFPAPPDHQTEPAISLRRVDGVWEGGNRGAARINRVEAEAIVAEIRQLLQEDPGQSIGVVTFNSQQRDHILNLLDEVRSDDDFVDAALGREEDALFVKNLENVQGDERDTILFSLAFGRDAHGSVPLNWGPLSRKGGERRFNVAVTRAKQRVIVFCSFDPHELDLSRSTSQGLADLKDYLLAARDGIESTSVRRSSARDHHLEDISNELRAHGLELQHAVGLSDFAIDIAARTGPEHRWIGILLDGPAWAARESVGDREGLPSTILTDQMGWAEIERVWLPTWIRDRAAVTEHLVQVANGADGQDSQETAETATKSDVSSRDGAEILGSATSPSMPRGESSATSAATAPSVQMPALGTAVSGPALQPLPVPATAAVISVARAPLGGDPASSTLAESTESTPASGPGRHGHIRTVFEPASTSTRHETGVLDDLTRRSRSLVRDEILDVIETEGPVLGDRLARVVAARFDLTRVRQSRRDQILAEAPTHLRVTAENRDVVYWPEGTAPDSFDQFRVPADGTDRDISAVPYAELRAAMQHAVTTSHGLSQEDALRATMYAFNVRKLGSNVRERLQGVLDAAIGEGRLIERDGFITEG